MFAVSLDLCRPVAFRYNIVLQMSLKLEFQIGNVVIFAKLLQLREVQNMECPILLSLRLWRYRDRYVHGNCDVLNYSIFFDI